MSSDEVDRMRRVLRTLLQGMLRESIMARDFEPKRGSLEPTQRVTISIQAFQALANLAGFSSLQEAENVLVPEGDRSKLNFETGSRARPIYPARGHRACTIKPYPTANFQNHSD
jgi:hypothetical protein